MEFAKIFRRIAVGLSVLVFISLLTAALAPRDRSTDSADVANEWNAAIAQLGIEPVYPPTEDLVVGDVLLTITKDLGGKNEGKSLKIWHQDMTDVLRAIYKNYTYIFPSTMPKPVDENAIWTQTPATDTVFLNGVERKSLPLVMFPGFTFAHATQKSVGGGWFANIFHIFGAYASDQNDMTEVKIPSAETYGVPHLAAAALLREFCQGGGQIACTDKGARSQLSSLVGSDIFTLVDDKAHPGQQVPRMQIDVILISRVYMTRSIQTSLKSGSEASAQAKALLDAKIQGLANGANPDLGKASQPTEQIAPPHGDNTARQSTQTGTGHAERILSTLSNMTPGGSVSIGSSATGEISVSETFERPIVIGFRAARRTITSEN